MKNRKWKAVRKSPSEVLIWEGRLFIASVAAAVRDKDPDLIAAAPELVEALRECVEGFRDTFEREHGEAYQKAYRASEKARQLLARLEE